MMFYIVYTTWHTDATPGSRVPFIYSLQRFFKTDGEDDQRTLAIFIAVDSHMDALYFL